MAKKILWLISTLLLITSCTGKKTNVNKSKNFDLTVTSREDVQEREKVLSNKLV